MLGFITETALSVVIAEILLRFVEHQCILLGRRFVQSVAKPVLPSTTGQVMEVEE